MKELCEKYPALCLPFESIVAIKQFTQTGMISMTEGHKDDLYKDFKANISCIGLEPAEYETVIKWFCDTMNY
jgi:hypothetical protein